ncbi:MAG: Gfo/Idh/MocA family oxidoreductase [Phycisphaerae bacterium]|nr:Gfo/Idh/MocA family oxidoreductase [Phycisphaerae bacterium]
MSEKLRVGFAGLTCSGMPKRFALCMKENFDALTLTAAWDPDPGACEEFCKELGTEAAEAPEAVAAQSDVIVMDVKSCDTAEVGSTILKAGCALYVSKPLANNLENGRKLIAASRESGSPMLATSTMRYQEGTQEAAKRVADGELGPLQLAFVVLHHEVFSYLTPESEWHVSLKASGGPLVYFGVHAADMLEEIIGFEDIDWIETFSATLQYADHPLFRAEKLSDTDVVNIKYKDGKMATMHVGSGVGHYAYGGLITGYKDSHWFRSGNDYPSIIEKIVEMVTTGTSPHSLERTENVMKVLDLATRSGREGRRIDFAKEQ